MKAIINTKLILEDGIIFDGAITYEEGKITALGKREEVDVSSCDEIIDARGLYTAPGLVDIHNHGCREKWFYEDPTFASKYFLSHGATTVLPTFYHAMSKENMIEGAKKIREARKSGVGKIMEGIYMEGPFMRFSGSFSSSIKWSGAVAESDYKELIDAFGDMVKVWAIDPDRENIESFMAYAKEHTPNAVFAHGHSVSTFEAIQNLKHYGVKIRTHITNAGQAKGRSQVKFGPGGDHFCFYDPDIYAELIVDESGVHVAPGMVKTVIKIKGVERVCLISDHTTAGENNYKNDEAGGVWYGPDLNYDDRGWLAGSLMTLDNGVRNVMTHSGYGLCHAIRMASLTPAEAVGISSEVGSLKVGKRANMIIIDDTVKIKRVILDGEDAVVDGKVLI